jgi:hypothetical protein
MSSLTPLALTVALAKRQESGADPPRAVAVAGAPPRSAPVLRRKAEFAMSDLSPFIRETARRVHGRHYSLHRQTAADFIAQSPALVWSRIEHFESWYHTELPASAKKDSAKDFFAAWCYRELHYRYLDFCRQQKAQPKVAALEFAEQLADTRSAGPATWSDGGASAEPASVYDFSLSAGEAEQLSDWDALDGVILFSLAGQWSQVPAGTWDGWLDELGLVPPFPPEDFVEAARPKRRTLLAEALGVSRDVIYQRWLRLRKKYVA